MEQTTIRDTVDMELERESGQLPSLDDDFLYLVTYQTKKVFQWITRWCSRLGSSFSIFLQITQPAHLIAMLAVITLATLLYPNQQRGLPSTLKNLIYLGSFSTCLGTQIWMTFMSGLSLYFSLPRHHFGKVQRVLFPRYFMFNAALNLLTLTMYTDQQHGAVRSEQAWQILTLCISFAINLFVWLYMAPPLLHYMQEKNQIEEAAGIGMEVGDYNLGPLLSCPDYVKVYKAFRSIHMKIAVGNITTLACTTFHLYYISSNITIRH